MQSESQGGDARHRSPALCPSLTNAAEGKDKGRKKEKKEENPSSSCISFYPDSLTHREGGKEKRASQPYLPPLLHDDSGGKGESALLEASQKRGEKKNIPSIS